MQEYAGKEKEMMKKRIVIVVFLVVTVLLAGCSLDLSDSSETRPIVNTVGNETKNDTANETENNTTETDKITEAPKNELPTIEEQLCFTYEGLTVTAKSFTNDDFWGAGIKLLMENNSDKDLSIGCEAVIVNDYMLFDLFGCEVAAGKKSNETLYLSSDQLSAAGIDHIGKIEIYFYVYDSETYDTLFAADCVTLKTSLFDVMDCEPNDDGAELYNKDGIRIVGKYVDEDSFWGTSVLLYVENHSGKNITVSCDDLSVNGFMIEGYLSTMVYQGKMAMDTITLLSDELEANDIDSVDSIELKFRIYDLNTYDIIVETDPIPFEVK